MSIDLKKYPNLAGVSEHPPTCKECVAPLLRMEWDDGSSSWYCDNLDCDSLEDWTDAQMDDRLGSEAESAYEYEQETLRATGGVTADFLNAEKMARGLKS